MNTEPVYFLIRYEIDHFTCYARGISVLNVHDLARFHIVRFYPLPSVDLTPRIVTLQTLWRKRRALIRWRSHPRRLHYREQMGVFPSR